jgi:TRAP-type C4-dicarboxylate transport system permease small subunit
MEAMRAIGRFVAGVAGWICIITLAVASASLVAILIPLIIIWVAIPIAAILLILAASLICSPLMLIISAVVNSEQRRRNLEEAPADVTSAEAKTGQSP